MRDVKEIDKWFSSVGIDFRRKEKKDGTISWSFPENIQGKTIWFEFNIDSLFPFSQIKVSTKPRYERSVFPHIEKDGFLCLSKSNGNSVEKLQDTYNKAIELISTIENRDKELFDDFDKEFYSYWRIFCTPLKKDEIKEEWSLLDNPNNLSIFEHLYHGNCGGEYLLSTRSDSIKAIFPKCENIKQGAFFIKVENLPIPIKYPKTIKELLQYLEKDNIGKNSVENFKKNISYQFNKIIICSKNNVLFGYTYSPQHINRKKCKKKFQDSYTNKIIPYFVNRMDRSWIFGRDKNKDLTTLSDKTVVVVGCGSVGSFITCNLAQAGVSKFILIDDDALSYPNVSRHLLGMHLVGHSKVQGLKCYLEYRFPGLEIEIINKKFCEAYSGSYKDKINNASLLISATADKDTEQYLNYLQVKGDIVSPIVYGWTTKNCLSGHGIAIINKNESCLECVFQSDSIYPIEQDDEVFEEPACGAEFVPYGIIELSFVNSMISQLAIDVLLGKIEHNIHKIWIAPKEHIEACGGKINPEWEKKYVLIENGGKIINIPIIKIQDCTICNINN